MGGGIQFPPFESRRFAPPTMIDSTRYPRLSRIEVPADLRTFGEDEVPAIAEELRAYLIESVGRSGGHFGAGLGVIELTVALHYLYQTPEDRIVWDVGHQCYPHKILTGRRDAIHTVKQKDGVAPFPKREESEYDTFGVGHSSTSISAALGMAVAAKLKALLAIAGKVRESGKNVTEEDITRARAEGASDVEIHDAILIAAAFAMFNRYVDGLATWTPEDPDSYRERAAGIVRDGYVDLARRLKSGRARAR